MRRDPQSTVNRFVRRNRLFFACLYLFIVLSNCILLIRRLFNTSIAYLSKRQYLCVYRRLLMIYIMK